MNAHLSKRMNTFLTEEMVKIQEEWQI